MAYQRPAAEQTPPEAPPQAVWDALSPEERRRVVEELPSWMSLEEAGPPEGDHHADARFGAREALRGYFGEQERGVYVGSDLIVYYPATRRFAPDLIVAFDVAPGPREKWVVSDEGKGLDFVLEVLYRGDRAKDLERNVELYARLGIPEYFVYDRRRQRVHGFRLPGDDAGRYVPILPQGGRHTSEALGLDIVIEDDKLRFYHANARIYEPAELLERVQRTLDQVEARLDAAERAREEERSAREEERSAREEERSAREEERRAREAAERRLAEALEKLERLEQKD